MEHPSNRLKKQTEKDSDFCVYGFVDDVRNYIARTSVYVCPIHDGGGTRLKLLDAFSMGMVTVARP